MRTFHSLTLTAALALSTPAIAATQGTADIQTIVVIYAENRSFDNL